MGLINRRLKSLRNNENLFRRWLIDSVMNAEDPLGLLQLIVEYGAEEVELPGTATESERHVLFDRFYREIEAMRKESQALNKPCLLEQAKNQDLKSVLLWFGITETAEDLSYDVGCSNFE